MTRSALRQVIGRQRETRALIAELAAELQTPLTIEDADGRLLHGDVPPGDAALSRFPISRDGADIGWIVGSARARSLASLVDHLVSREAERKALGTEVLHLYREVNLIYSFSEKLAALLDLERVAQLTLREARHLIPASDAVIMLLDEQTGDLSMLAASGGLFPTLSGFRRGVGVIGSIAESGVAEIVNDIESDSRRIKDGTGVRSLVAAPLKVGERVIGVIALASVTPAAYTAAELKLLNTLALQTATAIENARLFERTVQAARERERLLALHEEAEVARARLEKELELAARIQADLFPAELPRVEGYEFAARNRPARQCGGDYYDALLAPAPDGERRVLACVADVSGKGLPASLVMSNMQATLRALLGRAASITELAMHASELLYASTAPNRYVTAALLEFSPDSGAGRFVSAGHVDCLLLKPGGAPVKLESTGTPLGLLPPGLPYGDTPVQIEPGDCAVLYTDGVPDAENEAGEDFGEARLLDVLHAAAGLGAGAIVGRVFDAIDQFVGSAPQFDDITMLVVRRT